MAIPSYSDFIRTQQQFETFEEQRRRIEKERLAKMQASISIPTVSEDEEELSPEVADFISRVAPRKKEEIIEEEELSPEVADFIPRVAPDSAVFKDPSKVPAPIRYDKDYSLEDLDEDRHFQTVANRFLLSIGTDDDIYETLRDSDWSITGALTRAYRSGKWTDQQKADYRYLRTKFDNADVGGLRHILEATKDIGIDIIADPLNWIAGLFVVGTGGAGAIGASAVARIAASQSIKTGAKKLAHHKGFRAVSMGLTEGAYDAGLINAGTQLTEIQTGIRQSGTEFSIKEATASAGIGAVVGATFVGGGYKLANYMLRKEHDSLVKITGLIDNELKDEAGNISPKKVKSLRKALDLITASTVGKPLTKFVEFSKDIPVFRHLLLNFRHDTFRRAIVGVRKEVIEKANQTFSRDADALSNTAIEFVAQALAPLEQITPGASRIRRFFNPTKKLTQEDDMAIWALLDKGDILDKYMLISPASLSKPLHAVTSKIRQPVHASTKVSSGIPFKERLTKKEIDFLKQYNPKQLEAAAKLKYFFKTAHKLASDIDAIDPKTGLRYVGKRISYDNTGKVLQIKLSDLKKIDIKRYEKEVEKLKQKGIYTDDDMYIIEKTPYSLFAPGQEISNYVPWKFILETVKEKKDILIAQLAKTSHARIQSKPSIKTFVPVETVKGRKGTGGKERKYVIDPETGQEVKGFEKKKGKIELSEDEINFGNFETKNLPHIQERVAKGESLDDIDPERWFDRYDSFTDIAMAELQRRLDKGIITKIPTRKEIDTLARKYKAEALVNKLLEQETSISNQMGFEDWWAKKAGSQKTDFLNTRNWHELGDKFLVDNGFIQTDVTAIVQDYAYKIGHKIMEEKYFGYGVNFFNRYLKPIRKALENAKDKQGNLIYEPKEIKDILGGLNKARDYATGGRYSNADLGKGQKAIYDFIKVSQVLAHLPLATLSSITEPLIALARSDLVDTSAFVKEFSKGIAKSIKKSASRFYTHMQAVSGKKVKAFKDLSDEAWLEAYRAGVATEQAMLTKIEGMFAEGLQTGISRNIINAFFNVTFLQQWTQGVQLGAFNFAKERSIRIIGELADDTNAYGIQLTRNARNRRIDQLREIGIDPLEGTAAYRRSFTDGFFDRDKFNKDSFYDTELIPSSALFSKEIILNPTAAELNKPMWFNSPGGAIFVQFAGYPTAFNNTVLKGFARDVIRHPISNGPKVVAAGGMMAGVATMMNAIRSGGESLRRDKKDLDIVLESFERPGLLGWGQHFLRYYEGIKYGAGVPGATLKAISGPFGGDIVDGIAYRTPWFLIAGTNLPGYGALTPEAKRNYKKFLKEIFDKKEWDPRLNRAKGGVVINVPNVKEEPDELKIRGVPTTYDERAGTAFQDEEERSAFAEGGRASVTETDEMYSYLTKDEDTYNIVLNKNPISIYTEDDLSNLDITETYYTGFKGNTVSDRLNAVRQSSTIGLSVTTNKNKAKGALLAAGKIKFHNVLKLDIDSATPEAVQEELNKNMDSLIKIDKVLGKEIIKATNDNLQLRDDVLNDDPTKTSEKEDVIARSKSFLVRHELLKLGYDAIKTKEGYTLLRENQFLPTEINKKGFKGNGLVSTLYRRQGLHGGGMTDLEEIEARDRILKKRSLDRFLRKVFEDELPNLEGDHGNIPVPTNDASEQSLEPSERSKDIGYGHKITAEEWESRRIHGIEFINEDGTYIPINKEQKRFISQEDIKQNVALARSKGWDKKLKERDLIWKYVPLKYKLPLEDLAYNVGGEKAGIQWTKIFDAIKTDNIQTFVKELRRRDAGNFTKGMDNRVTKVAAASGLIDSLEEAKEYGLTKADETQLPFLKNQMFPDIQEGIREQQVKGGLVSALRRRLEKIVDKEKTVPSRIPQEKSLGARLNIPINVRQFLSWNTDTTERRLSDEQMEALRRAAMRSQTPERIAEKKRHEQPISKIGYEDWDTNTEELPHLQLGDYILNNTRSRAIQDLYDKSFSQKILDPNIQLKTFIGEGTLERTEEGIGVVTDWYNFDPVPESATIWDYIKDSIDAGLDPYKQLRIIGSYFGPQEGVEPPVGRAEEGAQIKINLFNTLEEQEEWTKRYKEEMEEKNKSTRSKEEEIVDE